MNPIFDMPTRSSFGECLTKLGLTGTGVELGVFRGDFSFQLLNSWPGHLIGVDCFNNGTDFHILMDAARYNKLFIDEGRYWIIVNTTDSAANLVQYELDFVFVDADHSYESVKNDMCNWWPKIRSGGILCGHDYDPREGGVVMAVDEWMNKNPGLQIYLKPCGSWFIPKP